MASEATQGRKTNQLGRPKAPKIVKIGTNCRSSASVARGALPRVDEKGHGGLGSRLSAVLCVDVAAGPEGFDKKLDGGGLAGGRVNDFRPLAGEVDADLFARAVRLAHRRVEPARERPVVLAVLVIAITAGVFQCVLRQERPQGETVALELLVHKREVQRGPRRVGGGRARVEASLPASCRPGRPGGARTAPPRAPWPGSGTRKVFRGQPR